MSEGKTQKELIEQCFYYLNSFKRHRALENIKRFEKDNAKANYHQLKQYQFFDSLELGLRAIQYGMRNIEDGEEE